MKKMNTPISTGIMKMIKNGFRFLNSENQDMGLLVGNTTVIEHAGTYIEYSRTYQHIKYSPEKVSVGFILPKGVKLSDGHLLARGIVNAQLGLPVDQPRRVNELALLVFSQPLKDFDRKAEIKRSREAYSEYDYADAID
jgi:hypothetical protein